MGGHSHWAGIKHKKALVDAKKGKVGDTVSVAVVGIDGVNYVVNLSIRRFEQVQNRKVVAQYLKQAPRPTLGQLLQGSFEEETEEDEETKTAEGTKPEVK